jgi:hypothetical protein
MGFRFARIWVWIVAVSLAAPAAAALPSISAAAAGIASRVSTPVPEPSDFALFLIGVIGLLVGRRTSRSRRRSDDRDA